MYTCERCGCNYDAGEMKGRICVDCMERQQERDKHTKEYMRMIQRQSHQLMFDMQGCSNVRGMKHGKEAVTG
ncbi:hypothetical protein C809_03591 [Lachnospiraceae bacterium MD335]|nr:hypothetical protein C809_03591 [Lachnospiraceae bacterium MD335]